MIDVGLQFPEDETPGIDYIHSGIRSISKRKSKNIQAIILTHCHYDHIGRPLPASSRSARQPRYLTNLDNEKRLSRSARNDFRIRQR